MPKRTVLRKYNAPPSGLGTRATIVSSPVDHGSLAGLGDDDHTQYGALSQDETVSGDWTFSGDVTFSGTTNFAPDDAQYLTLAVDADLDNERVLTAGDGLDFTDGGAGSTLTVAVDVTDILGSGLTESSNNIDLAWGTPTIGTIEPDDSASAGSSTNPARSDHQHAIVCAITGTITPDASAAEGSASSFARSDHAHGIVCAAPTSNLSVSSSNSEGATSSFARNSHTHAITSSSNPGAAASLLASSGAGLLTLVELDTDTISDRSGGNLTIAPAGDITIDPTGNDVLPNTGYDINLGSIQKKYLTLHAAELWVETLVAQNTIATIGGRILVGPTTTLTEDLTSATSLLNGDFESVTGDDFDNWTEIVSDGNVEDENVIVRNGSHAVKLTAGASTDSRIYQELSVTGDDSYTFLFYARGDGTYDARYAIYDVTNTANIIPVTDSGVTGTSYTRVIDSFTVPATCATIRIIFYCPDTNGGVAYIDDASLRFSTISVEHNQMTADTGGGTGKANYNDDGDVVYMESDGKVEFMYIIDGPNGAGPYEYGVERDLDGTGFNDWYAGDAIFNTGTTNDGFIDLYSLAGVDSVGAGPTIVGNVRQSTTYNDWEERWAIGNLNGLYGIGGNNYYGVGIGDYDGTNYLLYDTNGGFQIHFADGSVTIDSDGITITQGSNTWNEIKWIDTDNDTIGLVSAHGHYDSSDDSTLVISAHSATGASGNETEILITAGEVGGASDGSIIRVKLADSSDYGIHLESSDTAPNISIEPGSGGDVVIESGILFVNDTANTKQAIGLTINQGTADDEIIALKSSEVSHAMTDNTEADTYGTFKKAQQTSGGLQIAGWKDADGDAGYALRLDGILGEAADTTHSTSGIACVHVTGYVTNGGTNVQAVGSNGNLFAIRNGTTTRFIVDAEGDYFYDGAGTSYDNYDDAQLVRTFARATCNVRGTIRSRWDDFVDYNEDTLVKAGILGAPRSEGGLINGAQLQRLYAGAIWQAYQERQELREEVERLTRLLERDST